MGLIYYISIALVTFVLMEGFTWCLHRYVMHGFLWSLHRDHHQKRPGFFEKNDYFFLIFAIPSWLCIMLGVIYKGYEVIAIGAGLSLYGACYFLVHDVIIHQRVKWFTRSNNTYIRSVRWAHKMHHKHLDKDNGESFGFLWVAKKYREKVKRDKIVKEKQHVG
jgi:beta-carotene 3-hydroxylase